jgi:hypothetical protein
VFDNRVREYDVKALIGKRKSAPIKDGVEELRIVLSRAVDFGKPDPPTYNARRIRVIILEGIAGKKLGVRPDIEDPVLAPWPKKRLEELKFLEPRLLAELLEKSLVKGTLHGQPHGPFHARSLA